MEERILGYGEDNVLDSWCSKQHAHDHPPPPPRRPAVSTSPPYFPSVPFHCFLTSSTETRRWTSKINMNFFFLPSLGVESLTAFILHLEGMREQMDGWKLADTELSFNFPEDLSIIPLVFLPLTLTVAWSQEFLWDVLCTRRAKVRMFNKQNPPQIRVGISTRKKCSDCVR